MDNYFEALSAFPFALIAIGIFLVFRDLWRFLKAERHFTQAVAAKLTTEAAKLADKGPLGMRHLYLMNLLGARKSALYKEDEKRIFAAAMAELEARDRRLIKLALKDNTDLGRVRYLDKVFNAALKLTAH